MCEKEEGKETVVLMRDKLGLQLHRSEKGVRPSTPFSSFCKNKYS